MEVKTRILSVKILQNRASLNQHRDTCCTSLVKKNHFEQKWIYFPEFTINHELQWELQRAPEILGHHNQGWSWNLHFKLFLSIDLLKKLVVWCKFSIDTTGCVGITGYWSEIFLSYLLRTTSFYKIVWSIYWYVVWHTYLIYWISISRYWHFWF